MPRAKTQIQKLGELIHLRYFKHMKDLNTVLSVNLPVNRLLEKLKGEIEIEGICFNVKIGEEEWTEYKYIPHGATGYLWFKVGKEMVKFQGEYGL